MRRAPIVLAGTVAGLVGVLSFHTSTPTVAIGGGTGTSGTGASGTGAHHGGTHEAAPGSTVPPSSTTTTAPPASLAPRTATGAVENYGYGVLAVKVTVDGSRITGISVPTLQAAEQYSQQLAQQAIPMLRSEVLQAQSAKINAISGATYTSEAYAYSLQSALDKLRGGHHS